MKKFLLMALVVFIVVKQLNRLQGRGQKPGALRCPHCTSRLEAVQEKAE